MHLNDYQAAAAGFRVAAVPDTERRYGLFEEVGEVAGTFKKYERGDFGGVVFRERLSKELGDVLWYLSQVALDNNMQLDDIAKANLAKLDDRRARMQLQGDGDTR